MRQTTGIDSQNGLTHALGITSVIFNLKAFTLLNWAIYGDILQVLYKQ